MTLATLALVNLFTLAAGIAVARLLPARLDAMKVPVEAAQIPQGPSSVLPAQQGSTALGSATRGSGTRGQGTGAQPSAAGLQRVLAAALSGTHASLALTVSDAATSRTLYDFRGGVESTPASTTKVATAVASVAVLGANTRFTTKVVQTATGIVLVGGGDPALAVNDYPAGDYPQPATLASLAKQTATALRAHGRTSVHLDFDASLFQGAPYAPGWTDGVRTTGNATPIVSLEVDQGRLTRGGQPEDADDPTNFRVRTPHPAQMAIKAFVTELRNDGITITGAPGSVIVSPGVTIAAVDSPTVAALVQQMLSESNNVMAEDLARHVALAMHLPATFAGAATAIAREIRDLGVTDSVTLVDGSGLSPRDGIAPHALVETLEVAAAQQRLRTALQGLPVAGFNGTLSVGQSVFGGITGAARGTVRAKTGNLQTVATLAGFVTDGNGRLLVFAIMADRFPAARLNAVANAIDSAAAGLATCGCQ
jgi:D-alanyl-D-alanine carboxypeptidase/D-alanyl-D-alanine-endopeptidase (penicillin-binding protein 4)